MGFTGNNRINRLHFYCYYFCCCVIFLSSSSVTVTFANECNGNSNNNFRPIKYSFLPQNNEDNIKMINPSDKNIHIQQITQCPRGGGKESRTISRKNVNSSSSSSSAPLSTTKKINPHFAVLYGMVLAFNSGLINGITLSGILSTTKVPSSAVTGAWTNSALLVAQSSSNIYNNLGLKCIASYMSGSFIAGFLNPYPMKYNMKRYTVRPSFLIASLAMFLSHLLVKGSTDSTMTSWIFLVVLANGIQNSITSSLTENLMRSAHYSGITSDIGTFLGQSVKGNKTNGLKLKVFIVLASSFWMGGYFSLGLLELLGSKTLLLSSLIYLFFALFSI